jgi:hypothetical protein
MRRPWLVRSALILLIGLCLAVLFAARKARPAIVSTPCPFCHSRQTVPIVYGDALGLDDDDPLMLAHKRGELVFGGCVVRPNSPDRCCTSCGKSWPEPDPARPGLAGHRFGGAAAIYMPDR